MGDGINEAAALRDADVGISVGTAVDIAKESADIILPERDLTVLPKDVMDQDFIDQPKILQDTTG